MPLARYKTTAPLSATLPLAYKTLPTRTYNYRLVAKLAVPMNPGDLAIVNASGEASTPSGHTVSVAMFGRYLKATTTDEISATEGISVSKAMTHNITDAEHHSTFSCGGSFTAQKVATYNIMYVFYAASLTSPTDTKSLVVNYVDLDVVVFHGY